ncbi:hypothetical protein [Aquipuribacter sp. MA13-6]|uniref:hypothetical protein n=1 Tax=unclassified Aquipuribacter TaxID=2635084 RepID=UPI003EEE114C
MADIDRVLSWAVDSTGTGTAEAAHHETRRMLTLTRSLVEDFKGCSRKMLDYPDADVRSSARRVAAALADCKDALYEALRDIERHT